MRTVVILTIVLFALLVMPGFMPVAHSGEDVRTVVIDAGHGGYDLGIRTHEIREKDVVLKVAKRLKKTIEKSGRYGYLEREVDHYMSVDERRQQVNQLAPDVFLSLHLSGSEDINIYFAWFEKKDADLSLAEYYNVEARQRRHLYESAAFARNLASVLREAYAVNVYVREMSLPLLESIGSPAIMVELPSKDIDYDKEMGKMVSTLYNGIVSYERQ